MSKLLTLDDLYSYYVNQGNSIKFSADNNDDRIVVQLPGKIDFKKKDNNLIEGLNPVKLVACHTSRNLNNSAISKEVMEKALPSFYNRPILGYIHEVDGKPCFGSHAMHMDDNGEVVYDEIPVGIIPESANAHLEYDEEADVDRVIVNGYLFDEYTKATEIVEREEKLSVSVELAIRELSYDAKEKVLNIEDFYFSGVTILQCDDEGNEVKPGMAGSNIQMADFSQENNSITKDINEKLDNFFERIENLFSNIDKTKEGGNESNMNHFEELLEKYNVTAEDIQFEYAEMTDEELDAKFEELFGEESASESEDADNSTEEGTSESTDEEDAPADEGEAEETSENEDEEPATDYSVQYSMTYGENTKNFAVSLNDKIYALQSLVNDTYADADADWYYCDVYEEGSTRYVVMHGWNRSYRQTYKVKNDTYQLTGDRIEVFATWLSLDEQKQLDSLKSNYAIIEEELKVYKDAEDYADKMEVFEDESYEQFLETDEFKALMSDETVNSCTKVELKDKAELAFAKLIRTKENIVKPEEKNVVACKKFATEKPKKKSSRYGSLFSKEN